MPFGDVFRYVVHHGCQVGDIDVDLRSASLLMDEIKQWASLCIKCFPRHASERIFPNSFFV